MVDSMNEKMFTALACVVVFGFAVGFISASMSVKPDPQQPQSPPMITYFVDGTLGWRTPKENGAAPADVLRATIGRMEYEQGTPLGNDRNAKALIKAKEALAILEGREIETKDGFPLIE